MKTCKRSSFPFLSICKAGAHTHDTAHRSIRCSRWDTLELHVCMLKAILSRKQSASDREWTDPGIKVPERCQESLTGHSAAPISDTISAKLHQARLQPPDSQAQTCLQAIL